MHLSGRVMLSVSMSTLRERNVSSSVQVQHDGSGLPGMAEVRGFLVRRPPWRCPRPVAGVERVKDPAELPQANGLRERGLSLSVCRDGGPG